jgi:peptide/nickel transport system permease protein
VANRALLSFLARKLGMIILVMLFVTFFTTLLVDLIPGSPAFAIYGNVSVSFANSWNKSHGLDNSIWVQYWDWLSGAIHGNLGSSWADQGGATVSSMLGSRIPVTAEIAVAALVVSLLIAIVLAIVSALRPNGIIDRFVTFLTSVSAATPPFVSSVFLVAILAVHLNWLPSQGFVPVGISLEENLKSITLPVITLALALGPIFLRVLRGDLVSLLDEDFVSVARSRGLPEWYIMTRHVLRPASASLITIAGLSFAALLGGAIIVEIFYGIPGLGNLAYQAVNNKDVPVVQGVVVCVALFFAVVNIAVDLLHKSLDPRVRSSS